MATKRQASQDSNAFLARVGKGWSIAKHHKGQIAFFAGAANCLIQEYTLRPTTIGQRVQESIRGSLDFAVDLAMLGLAWTWVYRLRRRQAVRIKVSSGWLRSPAPVNRATILSEKIHQPKRTPTAPRS
jgi:hypothetical protein